MTNMIWLTVSNGPFPPALTYEKITKLMVLIYIRIVFPLILKYILKLKPGIPWKDKEGRCFSVVLPYFLPYLLPYFCRIFCCIFCCTFCRTFCGDFKCHTFCRTFCCRWMLTTTWLRNCFGGESGRPRRGILNRIECTSLGRRSVKTVCSPPILTPRPPLLPSPLSACKSKN